MTPREKDAAFAERVLGWRQESEGFRDPDGFFCFTHELPEFTRSLDAAWMGVEKLDAYARVTIMKLATDNKFSCQILFEPKDAEQFSTSYSSADHPAEALVDACLAAVEGKS